MEISGELGFAPDKVRSIETGIAILQIAGGHLEFIEFVIVKQKSFRSIQGGEKQGQ